MKFSTKSRYGLRALFDMAYHSGTLPAQIKDISRRQNISPRYLEQIFQDLKKAGLLNSRRGPQGGYSLAKKPQEISVRDIVLAAEGAMTLTKSDKKTDDTESCEFDNQCVTQRIWAEASQKLEDYFESVTLKDLCDEGKKLGLEKELDHRFMYYI
ncbi:MAG: Rrf2 family transcriptional regulator [Desulfuromonadaceae bacterium]|nr:Rrf2 family transcriptional regulator [Desulfuromonadaceae bacterium]